LTSAQFGSQTVGNFGKIINIEKKDIDHSNRANTSKRFTIQNQNIARGASVVNVNTKMSLGNKTKTIIKILKRETNSSNIKRFFSINKPLGGDLIDMDKRAPEDKSLSSRIETNESNDLKSTFNSTVQFSKRKFIADYDFNTFIKGDKIVNIL
jgi:hypothetical protein